MATNTGIEDKALALLGSGVQPEAVAAALGVSAARISQLLSNEAFAAQVTELRFNSLQKHNDRDTNYDTIEDKLLASLDRSLSLMLKPGDILKAIQIINGAKRRGQSAPDQITAKHTIVNVVLPTQIVQKFTTNLDNQVIKAGDQDLLTMPSGNLLSRVEQKVEQDEKVLSAPNSRNNSDS